MFRRFVLSSIGICSMTCVQFVDTTYVRLCKAMFSSPTNNQARCENFRKEDRNQYEG